MSIERRNLLRAYGAELVLTPGSEGMNGAVKKAEEIASENPSYFMPQQFKNQANVKIHRETTGPEIVEAINSLDGKIGCLCRGNRNRRYDFRRRRSSEARTSRTSKSCGRTCSISALSGGSPGAHKIQGIGANFIPEILNREIYDQVITIENEEAFETARRAAKEEGILVRHFFRRRDLRSV